MSVVLVTGTSTGIGYATALAFARAGHRTWASMRNTAKREALFSQAHSEGLELEILALDVTDPASVDTAFAEVEARDGAVEVLVNNAGVGGAAPLEVMDDQLHRDLFEVNYWGAIRTMRRAIPAMREREAGAIINVSSGAGRLAMPNQIPYSASKFALEAASEALAIELGAFGIRVAIIQPGAVDTAIFENSKDSTYFDKQSPYLDLMRRNAKVYKAGLKHPSQPEDVAAVILEAVTTDEPRLRYRVGDAENFIGGRERVSDEEYVAIGRKMDDAEYIRRFKKIFDIDL